MTGFVVQGDILFFYLQCNIVNYIFMFLDLVNYNNPDGQPFLHNPPLKNPVGAI